MAVAVAVVAAGLVEERMVFLGQQHFENKSAILACWGSVFDNPKIMDQTIDSKVIVEDRKVGWRVKEDNEVNTLVEKDEIVMLLQKFMDLDSEFVNEIRERSKTLWQICCRAITNGGSCCNGFECFC